MDSSETEGLSSADGSTRYRSSTTRKTGSDAERLDKSDELLRTQPPATVARPRSVAERPVARQSAITPHVPSYGQRPRHVSYDRVQTSPATVRIGGLAQGEAPMSRRGGS